MTGYVIENDDKWDCLSDSEKAESLIEGFGIYSVDPEAAAWLRELVKTVDQVKATERERCAANARGELADAKECGNRDAEAVALRILGGVTAS